MLKTLTHRKIWRNNFAIGAFLLGIIPGFSPAASDTATITLNGRILANTCTIDENSATQTIPLPDISDRDIQGAGTTGGETEVSILLKECGSAASSVMVTASGEADENGDSFAFKNTSAEDAASGVGLYFSGSEKFKPDGTVELEYPLTPDEDNTLTFEASYVGTAETVTAGAFQSVVNMTFDYQ